VNVRLLAGVLAAQLLIVALLIAWAAAGRPDFGLFGAGTPAAPHPDAAALADVRRIVAFGPRPAGSPASRRLAAWLRARLPHGRYEAVAGGLRNVVGDLPGRAPAIVLGAHYDTKDIPGFVGANDGAAGAAVVLAVAHRLAARPRPAGAPEIRFVLFDGEESPAGTPDSRFVRAGLRGSKAYALRHRRALREMILVDFVGQRGLTLRRAVGSDPGLWRRLRAAARRAGVGEAFPPGVAERVADDHTPFAALGIPAIDLIDFDYACFHRRCDTPARISGRSLAVASRAVLALLRAGG
jgi:peptidase M28-like protein